MAEIVVEVKTLSVYMKCDKCQNGLMEPDGNIVLTKEPPLYPHKCNNCGYMENYPFRYPYQKLIPVEQLRELKESERG